MAELTLLLASLQQVKADRRATIQGSTRMHARALMEPISIGLGVRKKKRMGLGGTDVIALAWTDGGRQTTFFRRAV
jgi:hypothetical protein